MRPEWFDSREVEPEPAPMDLLAILAAAWLLLGLEAAGWVIERRAAAVSTHRELRQAQLEADRLAEGSRPAVRRGVRVERGAGE